MWATWFEVVAQMIKNFPAIHETQVQSLSLEEGMATIPVFLPGESQGQRSLAGYNLQGCKASDMAEVT